MSIAFGNRRVAAVDALHRALRTSHGIELSGMLNELMEYHARGLRGAVGTSGAQAAKVLLYANEHAVGLDCEGASGSVSRS